MYRHCLHIRKLGVLVLSYVIINLSEDVLMISKIEIEGVDNFQKEIYNGFSKLPLDGSKWLQVLISPHCPHICKISILIYLYFYCITAKRLL